MFNAKGQPVPFAPWPSSSKDEARREPLAWLHVPLPAARPARQPRTCAWSATATAACAAWTCAPTPARRCPAQQHDLLVDRGEDEPPVLSRLHVQLDPAALRPINLRVHVSASNDLDRWETLGSGLPLVALDDNGLRIERLQLDIAPTQARYLRLAIEGEGNWPAIESLQAERLIAAGDGREWKSIELTGMPVADQPGTFAYTSPAPAAIERLDLRLDGTNSVSAVDVSAREPGSEWWQSVADFTAFRLGTGKDEVRHVAPDVGLHREREWQVASRPALAQAPTLVLTYQPDRFVMLAQGEGPYVLVAGSGRAAREDYPVQAALAAASTPPQPATLGARSESGGAAGPGPEARRRLAAVGAVGGAGGRAWVGAGGVAAGAAASEGGVAKRQAGSDRSTRPRLSKGS